MSLTVLACFALVDSATSAKIRLSHRLASQPNANQLPLNPCRCLRATYTMPDALILLCLYFWNDVQLEERAVWVECEMSERKVSSPTPSWSF
ncbi:hypothetical protein QQF64_030035 [Cirrhinus molitorella]|uniref:Secreted protein n=1 Tax=Cirrhinus molitorella TaxID=172907 RepID=A0ABR3N298_9TELE